MFTREIVKSDVGIMVNFDYVSVSAIETNRTVVITSVSKYSNVTGWDMNKEVFRTFYQDRMSNVEQLENNTDGVSIIDLRNFPETFDSGRLEDSFMEDDYNTFNLVEPDDNIDMFYAFKDIKDVKRIYDYIQLQKDDIKIIFKQDEHGGILEIENSDGLSSSFPNPSFTQIIDALKLIK